MRRPFNPMALPVIFAGILFAITVAGQNVAFGNGHTKAKTSNNEDAASESKDSNAITQLQQRWVDDVLHIEGKTTVPNGTWLNISLADKAGTLVADEGFIWAQVKDGRFVVEGFTKDGWKPIPPGRYVLSVMDKTMAVSVEKPITVTKRPDFKGKSRLAEVREINVTNNGNAGSGQQAATTTADVSDFVKSESAAQVRHSGVESIITQLKSSGALRLECGQGKAWIDPALWEATEAQDKENLARAIFESCESKSVDIYDARSAKKIARYGSVVGFKAF